MMEEDGAIIVKNIAKDFRLPHERTRTIKAAFTGVFRKKSKKETMQHALKDVSFDVKKGEFFGIVGRNGSGKSTLLKILAGIYQPTKGRVAVRGKLVPFIELGVGFNPELTGRENVYLNGAMLGFSKKEIDSMYDDVVAFAELEQFMDLQLKNYSSGMQVRLAFSMAVRAKADILLIDEVLAVGDASFQRKCYEYFTSLKTSTTTVVFVSHDMDAVKSFCDRAMLIEDSRLVAIGVPNVIASQYYKAVVQTTAEQKDKRAYSKVGPSGEERWGDGQAEIISVKTDKPGYKQADQITIAVTIKAHQKLETPIMGFSVKNAKFEQLLGTNSQRLGQKLEPLAAGETLEVCWQVPNIFNEGTYYIDATIAHDGANVVADRWPDAEAFTIYSDQSTPYAVNPIITLAIKE